MISSGATYFPDLCVMSQFRFWKVADNYILQSWEHNVRFDK